MSEIYIGSILLSEENYLSLRKAYRKAVEWGKKEFVWGGDTWVTDYIKYVLELMETYDTIKAVMKSEK